MKYAGKDLRRHEEDFIVFPRGDEQIILTVKCVADYSDFDTLCPLPTPPERILAGGKRVQNTESPVYLKAQDEWSQKRVAWMMIKSLEATPELTWDKIDLANPDTWLLYQDELKESFSDLEINKLLEKITIVCGLNAEKIEAATNDFLLARSQDASE